MKTFEQLAQSAYKTFCKRFGKVAIDGRPHATWDELGTLRQECWLEVAKHIAAEIAAIH